MQAIRPLAVAGQFYPASKVVLEQMFEQFFADVNLPNEDYSKLKAVVAPHAWYIYSWPIAAYSYKAIKKALDYIPKNILILAPSHYEGFVWVSIWLFEKYDTLFWTLNWNIDLAKDLLKNYPDYFIDFPQAQLPEHALEVQLPFLRYILKDRVNEFKVLSLVFGQVDVVKVGEILANLNDVFIIVSSDLSHYLPYNQAIEKDKETLQAFLSKNFEAIAQKADACWIYPWASLDIIALKKNYKPVLFKYANSWDTAWDKSAVVGYASVGYFS